jgi:hypothetical protein
MRLLALAAAALVGTTSALDLTKVILRPTQVGKGYGIYARKDGFGVKAAPTLDLCGRRGYPSEKLRVARLQVDYLKPRAPFGLSNEVVTYRSGGAVQAMREVAQHAATCPHHPIITGQPGVGPLRVTITRLHDAKLLPGAIAVRVHAVGRLTSGKHVDQTSYAVYQRSGNVLSGIYSFGLDTPAQQRFVLHAAEASARVLQAAVHAPKGPPA